MIAVKHSIKKDLHAILSIAAILITIGLLFIYSSSSVYAMEKLGASYYFVRKQAVALVIGFIGLIIARLIPLATIKKLSPLLFLGSLTLTALTLVPGLSVHIHGSSRWLKVGIVAFQPSELLKIALILYVAYFLEKKIPKISSFTQTYIPFLCILGITSLILLKQPDFGLTVTLLATCIAMFFMVQSHIKHIAITLIACIPLIVTLILYKPYRLKRILTFLDPWADPQGAGFQIIQSLIAIGSGSFFGLGIGNSKQKFFYLPMQHTDFIFSIIAEETGFIGSALLILLYALFLYFGMRIAWHIQDLFSKLVAFGFITLLSLQAGINIAVATGLAPTKGIGLPFISYGNTSLICSLIMLGLLINIVRTHTDKARL